MLLSLRKETAAPPLIRLAGPRVTVCPPQISDMARWIAVRSSNQEHLRPFEPSWQTGCLTEGFFRRRLRQQASEWKADRTYSFLIFTSDDSQELLGGININNVCRGAAQFGSLGYWLAASAQGKGYMREALSLVIGYGFDKLDLHRFNAGCLTHNQRSINLLQKLGFKQEGFAAKYLEIAGEWQDHILFGLNKEDWKA